jgi:trimethylguanosine synthase
MNKLLCAKINSRIYKCQDRIELICEDFFDFARNHSVGTIGNHIKPDLVFLSPPWGGVNYMNEYPDEIDLTRFPLDGVRIFEMALKLSTNIVYFLPRNCNIENCVDLMRQLIKDNRHRVIELEQNFLDYKLIAISAYYGDLVQMKIKK